MLRRSLLLSTTAVFAAVQPSMAAICPPTCEIRHIAVKWDDVATSRLKDNPQFGPVGDAILGAVLHTAIYNTWTRYSEKAVPSISTLVDRRPIEERTLDNINEAISYAAYTVLMDRFTDDKSKEIFTKFMVMLNYNPKNLSSVPASIGTKIGSEVIANRYRDGSNYNGEMTQTKAPYADHTGYVPLNKPMKFSNPKTTKDDDFEPATEVFNWQPLNNPAGVIQKFANAQMGAVKSFVLTDAEIDAMVTRLGKPEYLKTKAAFATECLRVIDYSSRLTDKEKLMVEFWADGPGTKFYPTAHWRNMSAFVANKHNYSLEDTIKTLYIAAVAMADAGIITWRVKRNVNGSRPITGIRNLFDKKQIVAWGGPGRPVEKIYGETWSPYNPSDPDFVVAHQSPGFPSWPSGHTMFSSTGASVLRTITKSDNFDYDTIVPANFGMVEKNFPARDTPISFKTFTDAAYSATMSRVWSGIHFYPDCSEHVMLVGSDVGVLAVDHAEKLFNGV